VGELARLRPPPVGAAWVLAAACTRFHSGQASRDSSGRCRDRTRSAKHVAALTPQIGFLCQERPLGDLYRTEPGHQTFIIRPRPFSSVARLIALVLAAGLVACSGPGSRFVASETIIPSASAA